MNDLNQLLGDWAARQEPTPAALNSLRARVVEQLSNVAQTSRSEPTVMALQTNEISRSRLFTSWFAVLSVAASLLAMAAVFWSSRGLDSDRSLDSAFAALPANDVAGRQLLFRELDRMFDGQWRWLGEVNGRVHVQTEESSVDPANSSSAENSGVAVRLTIVRRRPGDTDWNVVWEASVLARSEEWVRLPSELLGDSEVSLWAYSLPDGSVLVQSDVALTGPIPVRHSDQQFFGASQRRARLWSAHRSDGEFQLIQSIARMESHHG